MEKMKKHNCYNCVYRKSIPGDAHSSCCHPSLKNIYNDASLHLKSIFAGRVKPFVIINNEIGVEVDKYGVKNGWCIFPFNFDPIWIIQCKGYKEKSSIGEIPREGCENGISCDECKDKFECWSINHINCSTCNYEKECKK